MSLNEVFSETQCELVSDIIVGIEDMLEIDTMLDDEVAVFESAFEEDAKYEIIAARRHYRDLYQRRFSSVCKDVDALFCDGEGLPSYISINELNAFVSRLSSLEEPILTVLEEKYLELNGGN